MAANGDDGDGAREPWERRAAETGRAYMAFRAYRDLGPLRRLEDVTGHPYGTVRGWSTRHDWVDRASAWDDETHRLDDHRRLEAIRAMHGTHQQAARMAMRKAIQALNKLTPEEIPAYAAARLLELGARLERDTLTVSVEELQGVASPSLEGEDPWERIARDFQASP
jgi:hypothetical protein